MKQLTLTFEPGVARRHRTLLACCAASVYRAGHGNVAQAIDMAPSNLSTALAGGDRKFGVDHLEKFLDEFGDTEPIFYLVDKYLKGQGGDGKERVVQRAETLLTELAQRLAELKADS